MSEITNFSSEMFQFAIVLEFVSLGIWFSTFCSAVEIWKIYNAIFCSSLIQSHVEEAINHYIHRFTVFKTGFWNIVMFPLVQCLLCNGVFWIFFIRQTSRGVISTKNWNRCTCRHVSGILGWAKIIYVIFCFNFYFR